MHKYGPAGSIPVISTPNANACSSDLSMNMWQRSEHAPDHTMCGHLEDIEQETIIPGMCNTIALMCVWLHTELCTYVWLTATLRNLTTDVSGTQQDMDAPLPPLVAHALLAVRMSGSAGSICLIQTRVFVCVSTSGWH